MVLFKNARITVNFSSVF